MSSVSIYNPAQNNYGTLSRDSEDGFKKDWPDLTPHDEYRHNHHHHYHHRHREHHHHRHSKHHHTSNNTSITTDPGESVPTPPSENHEWHMKIDTFETESQYVVHCELPGIHYKDVSVNVNDHTLEINAIKPLLTNTTVDSVVDLSEITYGPSSRVVRIPLYVDQNEAQISLVEGILSVVFHKIARPTPTTPCRLQSEPYGQQGNESTAAWLERLITLGAPDDIQKCVDLILTSELQQAGKNVQNFVENGPDIINKRFFDKKLGNIASLNPSSFAERRGKHSWSKNYSALGLNLHRPTREQSGIHTSLMSRELGVFADNVREVQLDHTDYTFTIDFCDAMCAVFVNESERREVANQLLSEYFDESICKLSDPEEVSNVGAILSQCGTQKRNTFPMLFLNYKWELCSSKASPGEQNAGYYMTNVHESAFARERSACPALLLTIAGPNLGISAAVYGAGPCVDPVVPLLPTLILKQDKSMMTMVARALKACKLCVKDLIRHYSALSNSALPADEVQQLMFPYPRSFQFEDREVHFAYDRQLGDKLVFEARVTSGMAMDLNIIVKFTDTYCVEAHELCFKCDESAPRLYSHSLLPGGWHMLVMESLAGEDFKPNNESASVQNKLTQVVNHLHNGGMVHGDLRGGNVRVIGERVCLLDFAWSGQAGKQRYPGFMNHTNIDWAELASDGLPLETAHDLHMLKQLVRKNSL